MVYRLCYEELSDYDTIYNYDYCVDVSLQDYIEYEYYKHFGFYYNDLSWFLESGSKEFVKQIEQAWWSNKFDENSYRHNDEFIQYLKDKNYEDAVMYAIQNGDMIDYYSDIFPLEQEYEINYDDYDSYDDFMDAVDKLEEEKSEEETI
jgi:hypothetical protein